MRRDNNSRVESRQEDERATEYSYPAIEIRWVQYRRPSLLPLGSGKRLRGPRPPNLSSNRKQVDPWHHLACSHHISIVKLLPILSSLTNSPRAGHRGAKTCIARHELDRQHQPVRDPTPHPAGISGQGIILITAHTQARAQVEKTQLGWRA